MQWLLNRFKEAPEKLAFIHEGRRVTYCQVTEKVNQYVSDFLLAGIQKGNTVVIVGDYSPEVFCAILALTWCDTIVIPLTKNSVVDEAVALKISGCKWYVNFNLNSNEITINKREVQGESSLIKTFIQKEKSGLILFSSGSTGQPKGILHDFTCLVEKFRKQRPPTVAIPFLMIDHFGGINTLLAITSGLGTVVTVSDRSPSKICEAIEKYKVELLPVTPSFLNLLIASKIYEKYNLSSLTRISYGTEIMPQPTLDRARKIFPQVLFLQTYGLSEVGVLHSQSRNDGSTWVRVGGDGFQVQVRNNILWVKSSYAMIGYLNAPSDFDEQGWFNTHDQVEVDGEYIRILGRDTDLINVGGQKVYPAEIESAILELENIEDVTVYSEVNPILGQIVAARVTLHAPEDLRSLKARIKNYCKKKLAPYKVPTKVIISEETLYSVRQKKMRKP